MSSTVQDSVTTATATSWLDNLSNDNLCNCKLGILKIKDYTTSFGIFPRMVNNEEDAISIYFHNYYKTFKFRANVSILNLEGKKLFTKEFNGAFENGITTEINFSLMSRSEVLSPENGYLFNDKLTLLCEFEVIEEKPFK